MSKKDRQQLARRRQDPEPQSVVDLLRLAEGETAPAAPTTQRTSIRQLLSKLVQPSPTPKKRRVRRRTAWQPKVAKPSVKKGEEAMDRSTKEPERVYNCSAYCNPERESCCAGASLNRIFGGEE